MPLILQHGQNAVVMLEGENLGRIVEQDPLVVDTMGLFMTSGTPIARVIITYVTPEQRDECVRLVRAGEPMATIKLACAGWSNQAGDGEPIYTVVDRGGGAVN